MPRRPLVTPNRHLHTTIPEPLYLRIEETLFSPLEGKVPQGALQSLIISLFLSHLNRKEVDLSPYLNVMPGEATVSAEPSTIFLLLSHLSKEQP